MKATHKTSLADKARNFLSKPGKAGKKIQHQEEEYSSNNNFEGETVEGRDFTNASMDAAKFTDAKAIGIDFTNASLRRTTAFRAVFDKAIFSHADLTAINCEGSEGSGASFKNARFDNAILHGGNFGYADFTGADLRNADLRNANFTGAIFTGAILTGAVTDERTVFDQKAFSNAIDGDKLALPTPGGHSTHSDDDALALSGDESSGHQWQARVSKNESSPAYAGNAI